MTSAGQAINQPLTEDEVAERIIQIFAAVRQRLAEKNNESETG